MTAGWLLASSGAEAVPADPALPDGVSQHQRERRLRDRVREFAAKLRVQRERADSAERDARRHLERTGVLEAQLATQAEELRSLRELQAGTPRRVRGESKAPAGGRTAGPRERAELSAIAERLADLLAELEVSPRPRATTLADAHRLYQAWRCRQPG